MKNFIEQQLRLSFAFFNLVLNREGVGGVKKSPYITLKERLCLTCHNNVYVYISIPKNSEVFLAINNAVMRIESTQSRQHDAPQ